MKKEHFHQKRAKKGKRMSEEHFHRKRAPCRAKNTKIQTSRESQHT
jgi:hypothetical protein